MIPSRIRVRVREKVYERYILYFQGSSLISDHEKAKNAVPRGYRRSKIHRNIEGFLYALLRRRYKEFDHENQYMQYQRAIVKDSVRRIVNNGRLGG